MALFLTIPKKQYITISNTQKWPASVMSIAFCQIIMSIGARENPDILNLIHNSNLDLEEYQESYIIHLLCALGNLK